ncbi:MAG: helix-turn-helix transcriptional regulator, partial [Polyangiaceae bacterium]
MAAFRARTTWSQHDLARQIGVKPRTLRTILQALKAGGIPLERQEENRSLVYWSVPQWWARGLEAGEPSTCLRLLARLPHSGDRDRMLARLLRRDVGDAKKSAFDAALAELEDASADQKVARITYRSTRDGVAAERLVSVQRIDHREPPRFIAVCHRTGTLKTFRVDRVESARAIDGVTFRSPPAEETEAMVARSFDGYDGGSVIACVFALRDPES